MKYKQKLTRTEKVGFCAMGVCVIAAIGGTILFSPIFLLFVPIGCVAGNTCNLRGK